MTAILDLQERLNVRFFSQEFGAPSIQINLSKNADGTGTVKDFPIFKTGTFKDSLGLQHTWEPEHLAQMVFHYELLRERAILPNVPVRADHSFSVDKIIGYVSGVHVANNILYADYDITEPDAVLKVERGTYRNRSAEIGLYETNDEAFYWPVLMGFAFVDLQAVEGLYSHPQTRKYTLISDKEIPKMTDQEWLAAATYAQAVEDQNFAVACAYAQALEDVQSLAGSEHSRPNVVAFSIGGQTVTDPAAVQSHINVLETFRADTTKSVRADYVKGLATAGKIAAPQVDTLTELAHGMTTEQFESFKASYEAAPASSLFQRHGGNGPADPAPGGGGNEPTEVDDLRETVAMHKRSGLKEAAIKETGSYKRLAELDPEAAKAALLA